MDRKNYLKALSEALGISYTLLANADIKCYIDEFLSDVVVGRVLVIDEKLLKFKYHFKKPIYRKKINRHTGRIIDDSEEVATEIDCMTFENKNSHFVFTDETLHLKSLLMTTYGLKHMDVDEHLRLPIKRFLKSFNYPQIKMGHKKIKFF